MPCAATQHGLLHHALRQRVDESTSLQRPDERLGRHQSVLGVAPPGERLRALELSGPDSDLGLEMGLELPLVESLGDLRYGELRLALPPRLVERGRAAH